MSKPRLRRRIPSAFDWGARLSKLSIVEATRLARWWVVSFGCALAVPTAHASDLRLGINYSWFQLGAPVGNCAARPASVLWQSAILPLYQKAEVRSEVQSQLDAMHQAGFTAIRTFVSLKWRPQKSRNEGPIEAVAGVLPPQAKANLVAFTQDIAKAGFKTLEISFGGVGLYCRKQAWGDCFDPAETPKEWTFTEETARTVISAAQGHLDLRFDLGNEGCPAPSMPQQTIENAGEHFVYLASRFQKEFGNSWLVSCANAPRDQRQVLMLRLLKKAGLSPKYLEVHSYAVDAAKFTDALTAANHMAGKIGATVILGESRYHSEEQVAMLRDWLKSTPDSRLTDVFQWPKTGPGLRCPIDTKPPYTPGPMQSLVN